MIAQQALSNRESMTRNGCNGGSRLLHPRGDWSRSAASEGLAAWNDSSMHTLPCSWPNTCRCQCLYINQDLVQVGVCNRSSYIQGPESTEPNLHPPPQAPARPAVFSCAPLNSKRDCVMLTPACTSHRPAPLCAKLPLNMHPVKIGKVVVPPVT